MPWKTYGIIKLIFSKTSSTINRIVSLAPYIMTSWTMLGFHVVSVWLIYVFCSEPVLLIYTVCYNSQWELRHRSNITCRLQKLLWALMFWPGLSICYIQYQCPHPWKGIQTVVVVGKSDNDWEFYVFIEQGEVINDKRYLYEKIW